MTREPVAPAGGAVPQPRAAVGVLADRIAAALVHREPGWRLPRRSALARRYNVSMPEIDAAIGELVRRSLIRRLPDGQLYRASPAEYFIPIEGIGGLATRLDPMGGEVTCQSRHVSRRDAPQDVTWALGVDGEEQVRIVRTVWTADGEPVAVATSYMPERFAESAGEPDDESFGEILVMAPGTGEPGETIRPTAVDLEMAPPQPSVARSLGLVPGQSAVSVTIRFDDTAARVPAGLTILNLKLDHFRIVIHGGLSQRFLRSRALGKKRANTGHVWCQAGNLKSMPAEVGPGTGPAPRRARYLIPRQLPRRGEIVAACGVVLIVAHLIFAQLPFLLAVVFVVIGRASRWRLSWLAVPAVAGAAWTLVTGPAAAAAGFAAGPAQITGYLGAHGLLNMSGAFGGLGGWLPRQFPLALIAASAEAAAYGWLDWLHSEEWEVRVPRPGLAAAIRRVMTSRAIRGGAVVTRNGATLGVTPETGTRAALTWAEIMGGVLLVGAAGRDITSTGFQVVHCALRLRKPVIVLDLTGDPAMGSALAAACSAAGTPLRTFGTQDGSYEPFRAGDPARRTELTLALLGVAVPGAENPPPGPGASATGNSHGAELCLRTAFELMSAVPADAETPVLDDVLHLLNPMAAGARLRLVPTDGPLAGQLADRVQAVTRLAQTDPDSVTALARQLSEVRRSEAGGWLRPAGPSPEAGRYGPSGEMPSGEIRPDIDLARVMRARSAVLFRLDSPAMARLVVADLLALGDDLRRIGVDGDAVVVLCGCENLPADEVVRLVDSGATAGLPVLATTTSGPDAAGLSEAFGTLVIHRLAAADARVGGFDGGAVSAAAALAARTGTRLVPGALAAAQAWPGEIPDGDLVHGAGKEPSSFLVPDTGGSGRNPAAGSVPAGGTNPAVGAVGLVAQPVVPVRTLLSLGTAQFTVAVRAPRPRLVTLARTVPARLPHLATAGSSPAEKRALDRLRANVARPGARAVATTGGPADSAGAVATSRAEGGP